MFARSPVRTGSNRQLQEAVLTGDRAFCDFAKPIPTDDLFLLCRASEHTASPAGIGRCKTAAVFVEWTAMNALVSTMSKARIRRLAGGIAVVGLLARALIPLGYMPGNLLAGEFMILCPTGLPLQIADSLHRHHDDSQLMFDADRVCPIGAALQYAAVPADVVEVSISAGFQEAPTAEPTSLQGLKSLRVFRAREPPPIRI